jgi:UDP-N-acetylmuramoyl-tripeptide--D-alanyl-D-alanine ligase
VSPLWTADEVLRATGGDGPGGWTASRVVIDTRGLEPGDLFVALVGEHRDGHAFLDDAAGRGAAAALVHGDAGAHGLPLVRVANTQAGLEALGRAARSRSAARFVAVTGSVGKTGSKEALRLMLEAFGPSVASAKSHNNHWGVPLTLANVPREARFAVIEIGMNHAGEIARLVPQARPQVALITKIAPAHLGNLGSLEAIARAKAEIFTGLEPDGTAVLNADDDWFELLASLARAAGAARIVSFGTRGHPDVRVLRSEADAAGSDVLAECLGQPVRYRLPMPGRHLVENSLGWLAVIVALGLDPERAAARLAGLQPLAGRGQRRRVALRSGTIELIDDGYNANPASVRAALDVLALREGRRIAVLGDMLELGADAEALHRELAGPVQAAGVDLVFGCGPAMRHLLDALPMRHVGGWAPSAGELVPMLRAALRDGDVVLVKGSLGSRMADVTEALCADSVAGE